MWQFLKIRSFTVPTLDGMWLGAVLAFGLYLRSLSHKTSDMQHLREMDWSM